MYQFKRIGKLRQKWHAANDFSLSINLKEIVQKEREKFKERYLLNHLT